MAANGASGHRRGTSPRDVTVKRPRRTPRSAEPPRLQSEAARAFVLGIIPGATPGKWIAAWRDRYPHVELTLHPLAVATQREALATGIVDAALVRLPLDRPDDFHVIALYEETPVVVVAVDSHLTAADELELSDLRGEVVIVPEDDVLHAVVPGGIAPGFAAPADMAEAVGIVAAGVGAVLAPMSLARLHARKDLAARPVRDAPVSAVALAWPRDATTPDIDNFVGIVRGRTPNSSR